MSGPLAFWTCGYRTADDGVIHWFMGVNRQQELDLEADRKSASTCAERHIEANRKAGLSWAPIFNRPGEILVCSVREYTAHMFRPEFSALEPAWQELLRTLFPDVATALDDPSADFLRFKPPAHLQSVALSFLNKIGLTVTCPRCGGTGKHSSCERFGTTCFKCGHTAGQPGRGWVAPKLTRKLLQTVRERIAPQQSTSP